MSLTNNEPFSYSTGFTQPMEPLPAAKRAALIFEKKAAATGHDAEVPATPAVTPVGSVVLGTLTR